MNECCKLTLFPDPIKVLHSSDYNLTVNGQKVFLQEFPGFAGGSVAIAFLDFEGPAEFKLTSNWHTESAEVHPLSYGIKTTLEDKTVTFTMPEARNVFVKFNDSFMIPVYIFASKPMECPLEKDDPNLLYYSEGIHDIGNVKLESGQTVYLEPGAVVNGTFRALDAENITICGRGMVRTSYLPHGYHGDDGTCEVIGFGRCKNIRVEGITIMDSFGWTLIQYECEDVVIRDVKIVNERPWSTDGINPCNCKNVLIEKCFVRAKDDCISVKGLNADDRPSTGKRPIDNVLVRDCVFWSDNNNALVLGSETVAEYIRGVHFVNCDILKVSDTVGDRAGAMSIISLHDNDISDVSFEDIRVEYTEGPVINIFFCNDIFRIPGERKPGGGRIRDVLIKNVSVTGGPKRWSFIRGMDENHLVENVVIDNYNLLGKKVENAEDGKIFVCNAKNIQFR